MAAVSPSAMELLRVLKSCGISAYFVGGCVRDLLRGVEPSDYDLTSSATPEEMMALFGDKAHPTGIAHGTVTVVYGAHAYEITTMRRDGVYLDARHPESVEFTKDMEIMMFTDGINEAVSPFGEQFGVERIKENFTRTCLAQEMPEASTRRLMAAVDEFTERSSDQADDQTLVIIRHL